MRWLVFTYIFLSFSSPAWAYIEEDTAGMAETSAGDQNTNMYKLNSRTDYLVKKLRKIDEYAAKNSEDISPLNVSSLEDISSLEQKDREKQQTKKILEEVVQATANPQTLRVAVKPDVYLSLLAANEVRDSQVAAALQRQLQGGRR